MGTTTKRGSWPTWFRLGFRSCSKEREEEKRDTTVKRKREREREREGSEEIVKRSKGEKGVCTVESTDT